MMAYALFSLMGCQGNRELRPDVVVVVYVDKATGGKFVSEYIDEDRDGNVDVYTFGQPRSDACPLEVDLAHGARYVDSRYVAEKEIPFLLPGSSRQNAGRDVPYLMPADMEQIVNEEYRRLRGGVDHLALLFGGGE